MKKITVKIDGMMCGMCEVHICDTIRRTLPDAGKVSASRIKGEASFLSENSIDEEILKKAINDTGYTMNWFSYFENVPGKDEYYITHKQCGIRKLTEQEHCREITKYLCMMDYYTFERQGAVLDRTKTLGYGDDECNFHLMSKERTEEIGFVKNPDAK